MEDDCCPLCMDQLDATDKAINYCACGYRMCLWCWNQLMETAGKENLPGRCPNCRAEYDKEKITMSALDPSVVEMEQQRKKETKKKGQMAQQHRPPRSLGQVRVVQRTLVYCVGLPMNICREEVLSERNYFGGFGRIKKISVNRSTPFSQVQKNGPSGSAYVTYYRAEDALRCIEAIDGTVWDGKTIKACFGTTKYCNAFLKGVPCNNTDCLYLHEIADLADSFSKEDMVVNGLTSGRSTFFDLVHPTNTQEASAHAHAAINAANNSNGSGSSCSTDTGGALTSVTSLTSGVGGAVQGAVVAGSTAGGPAVAGVMPAKTQPIAISGGRISSSNPWGGSGTGDSAATSPAPAAAGQWGSTPKLTPTALRSQLADMEWPSLGGEMEGPKAAAGPPAAPQHQQPQHHHQQQQQPQLQTERTGGAQQAAASTAAAANGKAATAAVGSGLTLAAVTAGLRSAAAAAAVPAASQQQPPAKQRKGGAVPLGKPAKTGKAASHIANGDAGQACGTVGGKGTWQDGRAGTKEAQAAAAATNIVADSSTNSSTGRAKDLPASKGAPAAEPVANGKLSKQEEKAMKSAAAAAAAASVAVPAPVTPVPAVPAPAVPEPPAGTRDSEAPAAAAGGACGTAAAAQDGGSPVPAGPAAKSPPPGFAGAGAVAAGKGPPPGFSGQVKPVQQRLPPPGFEPSLIALARASSSSNVSQLGPGASSSTRSSSPGGGAHSDAAAAVFALGDPAFRQLAPEGPAGSGDAPGRAFEAATSSSDKGELLGGQQQQQQQHLGGYHSSSLSSGQAGANGGPAMPGMSHTAFDINAFFDAPAVGGAPGAIFDVAGGLLGPGTVMGPGTGAGGGAAAHAAVSPVPLSARKQSRWGFAQQASPTPAAMAAAAAAAPAASPSPGPAAVPQQLPVSPPPPGFNASFAPGGSPGVLQGSLSFANQTQQATSFFKSLLPGVNVHVASSAAAPAAVGAGAASASQAEVGSASNPGLMLLQQLQRGQQQQPQQQQQQRVPARLWNV